ncbi:PIG-L family deacetylase [Burkholderia sp. Ac-20365]|uniref:PIG-L family deacetylase n=1 Tax=Burkholderia sp. Ac-20365 TaxID=2703897 RepID=UPI00197BCC1E|nr:PIG-L family deacetylase [Burkholderia sp. Ac-20365]MBN3759441.1 ricin-type beta-trefoil lectin domain protein [Burkholderia sp. Ac-20365]
MNTPRIAFLWFPLRILYVLCLCFMFTGSARAATVDCSAGTLVTVVAHLDDDLLFVEPAISDQLRAGWCVTVVHLIGGANGTNFAYVQKREEASRLAYARLAGVANTWDETTLRIEGKPVYQLTLKAQPRVRLLELRLPGGAVRGGRVPLALLWDQGATLTTYPMGHGELAAARYTRASLSAVLQTILKDATRIATLNPDTVPFIEHPDHIYAARITRHVAQNIARPIPIVFYTTYPTGNWPATLFGEPAQRKRDAAASYFSIDGGDFAHVFGEYQWDGNWVLRNYSRSDTTLHKKPDFVAIPSVLFNTGSSQCLTSQGNSRGPQLAPCDDSMNQQWRWEPRTTYAGNQHNAALVSASTGQCVAEHDGALTEEPCEEWNASQRWTPWDFGLIFTPSRRCLGEENNRLNIRGCTSLTTRYRWSTARPTWSTDLRLSGVMYGDVTGHGTPSAIYVQRRPDGPGFDIYVQTNVLGKPEAPEVWYSDAVRFDSRATKPTCGGERLCFDSARFVAGDFDGDGRTDLMIVTPGNGGSAFWMLHSSGNHFSAPVLWFQSDGALPAELAQQYLPYSTGDTSDDKLLVSAKKPDNELELWTIGSDRSGKIQQSKAGITHRFKSNAHLLALRSIRKDMASFVAIQSTDDNRHLSVTPLSVERGRWSVGVPYLLPEQFKTDTTRVTGDPRDEASIVMTVPHYAEPGGVDIWKLNTARQEMAPVLIGYRRDIQWQDAMPSMLSDGTGTALLFYERADAILNNTQFSSGNSVLSRYSLHTDGLLGTSMEAFPLPFVYSETLWPDRLFQ